MQIDRRVKLSEDDRKRLIELKEKITQRGAAEMFGVSRRLVQFIWYPERHEENKKRRAERGGSKIYYNRENHNKAMRSYRKHQKELKRLGLI